MENNDFDRSDFNELLGYIERLRQGVRQVQRQTDSFCTSFSSGLEKTAKGLANVNLNTLSNGLMKIQQNTSKLNKWVSETGNRMTGIGIENTEAAITGLASLSEMTYRVLDTMTSLNKFREIKITTNADENKKALEGIIGSGERMKALFDELQANPLPDKLGIKEVGIDRLRSGWEVLQKSKEDIVGMMTTYGQGRSEVSEFAEGWKTIRKTENRSLRGFGPAVKAIFKKKERQLEEQGEKPGFFSIFRKKEEGDKNWFTAVGHRFNNFKDRTKAGLTERFTPLVDYVTRVSAAYAPLQDMAGNAMNVVKLGGNLKAQAHIAWLNTSTGLGAGDREQNLAKITKLKAGNEVWNTQWLGRQEKAEEWSEKIRESVGKMNTQTGENPSSRVKLPALDAFSLAGSMPAPEIAPIFSGSPKWEEVAKPVNVHIDRLIENLTITPADLTEGVDRMKQMVADELLRILNNVNNWACETNLK